MRVRQADSGISPDIAKVYSGAEIERQKIRLPSDCRCNAIFQT
jgi:hypothetical protein